MFYKEVVIWKYLNHKNIVPLIGATIDPPQVISVWMPGGSLTEYAAAHPEANRLSLVSFFPAASSKVLTFFPSCTASPRAWNIFIPAM